MRAALTHFLLLLPGILGGALLGSFATGNLVAFGAAALATALALCVLGVAVRAAAKRSRRAQTLPGRSAVRLALRLARLGQRSVLVDCGTGLRLARLDEATPGARLQYVGTLGSVVLARQRT